MRTVLTGCRLTLVGLVAAVAGAQGVGRGERSPADVPNAGFWPTERMMHLAIDRITEEMAKEYAFDEAQLWNTRELLKERFPRWLEDNRAELQTLLNQYIEAVMAGEPPSPEHVADWARRAKPLFEEFTTLVEDTVADMGTYLTDEQRVLVEGQMAAFRVGAQYMNQRLDTWSHGGYDWRSEWPRSEEFKARERERQKQLEREATAARNEVLGIPNESGSPSYAAAPAADTTRAEAAGPQSSPREPSGKKDEWEIYVEDFIRRYQLDEAQRNNAYKYLRDQMALRDRYLRSRLSRITAVENKLKAAQTDEEREKVRAELKQLHDPIEQMFEKLKERLDRLPTRKQRALAAAAGGAADSSSLREQMQQRARSEKKAPTETSGNQTSSAEGGKR